MLELVELNAVHPSEMDEVLASECRAWHETLDWDYSATTALIARSIAAQAFHGFALRDGSRVLAYSYFLPARDRSLFGSVHALGEAAAERAAARLLDRSLAHLVQRTEARRIESQFLYFGEDDLGGVFSAWGARAFPRQFLRASLREVAGRVGQPAAGRIELRPLVLADVKPVAQVIHASFLGSPDAEMSACYADVEGCLGFVDGVLTRTGCGSFEAQASLVALERGGVAGAILVSRVSPQSAHVVQISVAPGAQGRGIGAALLGAAVRQLGERGFAHLTLSVTTSNARAREWYLRLGFEPIREFAAYVRER